MYFHCNSSPFHRTTPHLSSPIAVPATLALPASHPQASPISYSMAAKTRRCCLVGFAVYLLLDVFPIHQVFAHGTFPDPSLDLSCRLLDWPFLKLPERGRTKYVSCSNLEGAHGRGYKRWVILAYNKNCSIND